MLVVMHVSMWTNCCLLSYDLSMNWVEFENKLSINSVD